MVTTWEIQSLSLVTSVVKAHVLYTRHYTVLHPACVLTNGDYLICPLHIVQHQGQNGNLLFSLHYQFICFLVSNVGISQFHNDISAVPTNLGCKGPGRSHVIFPKNHLNLNRCLKRILLFCDDLSAVRTTFVKGLCKSSLGRHLKSLSLTL